eukprot:TRINITY_DN4562_c0_g2_i1.p2 TRINITY_DN4562_c0_g2~~TRINITY_DN4562_c0_g2_i1.p2  ORF type:complete len:352 (-),score=69.78 TRINITY_DN4562_c0_g2_i1:836-1891(-)
MYRAKSVLSAVVRFEKSGLDTAGKCIRGIVDNTTVESSAVKQFRIYQSSAAAGTTPVASEAASQTRARGIALPVGMLAGIFGSIVGVGGGVLIGPMIVHFHKTIPQRVISGTSLAAVISTGCSASYTYGSNGFVDPIYALIIAVSAVMTAPLGARFTKQVDSNTLRKILGYFLIAVAPLVPIKQILFSNKQEAETENAEETTQSEPQPALQSRLERIEKEGLFNSMMQINTIVLGATGTIAGFASGLLGIGGGTIVTPLLAMSTDMNQKEVLGTSLLAMIIPSFVGLMQHWKLGNVDWIMAAGLAAGTVGGSFIGSNFALQAPPGVLESVFAGGMLFLGMKTLQAVAKVKK